MKTALAETALRNRCALSRMGGYAGGPYRM